MSHVCPSGHAITEPLGDYCPEHGARLFEVCRDCNTPWPLLGGVGIYRTYPGDFCVGCGRPGAWISREQRLDWIGDRLLEESLDEAKALELREMLQRLKSMAPDDDRAASVWRTIHAWAPRSWPIVRSVVNTLASEGVRKLMEKW